MAHSMAEVDLHDVFSCIKVPTLPLYGELDKRSPLKIAHDLRVRILAAQLVVLEGASHLTNAEAPDEFDQQMRQFVRSVVWGHPAQAR